MSPQKPGNSTAYRIGEFVGAFIAEHGVVPTVAQVRDGGVRARTATIAAALRQARAEAARSVAASATSPDAVAAVVELGRAMAEAAQRVLDEQVGSVVERVVSPARAASNELIAAAFAERDAVRAEVAAVEELRENERWVLERQLEALREELGAVRTERDNCLSARDLAFADRDRAVAAAASARDAAERAQHDAVAAREEARAVELRGAVELAEERGRRLAAEERVAVLESRLAGSGNA